MIQAENAALTSLDVALTTVTLHSWMYASRLVKLSWQLLNDSAFPIDQVLGELMGLGIGRLQNTHFTTGSGSGQPLGFTSAAAAVTLATGNTTTFSTGAVGFNALVALTQSVDVAYRRHPSCAWQMNDATYTAVRELADTTGHPLLLGGADALSGTPQLLGWPVYVNPDMATMAANAKTIAFGAWGFHYVIRDVGGLRISILSERFADQLQTGVFGTLRSDGAIADPKAVKRLAMSAT